METLLGILGLAGILFGLVNLVRPTGWLGISSRSGAGWLVAGSLVVLLTASALDRPPDPGRVESGATTTAESPEAATSTLPRFPASTSPADTSVPPSPPATTAAAATGSTLDPAAEIVTVTFITDGDTIEIRRGDESEDTVRLIGVNAPENGECWAPEAAGVLERLIPPGTEVGMTTDVSDRDRFGRLLRYLWVGSMSVNEELVRRGAAIARWYPPDTALSGRFEAAQTDAQTDLVGLWAPDACGDASEADVRIFDLRYDAEGNDNENQNGEWMKVGNRGDTPVDMTGWGIKDESATNRFAFPSGFVLGSGEVVTVYTGCGVALEASLFWCSVGSAVWNNDGDTAFLTDPSGNTHFSWSYSP